MSVVRQWRSTVDAGQGREDVSLIAKVATAVTGRSPGTAAESACLSEEQAALRRVATLVARGARPEEVFATMTEEAGRLLEADLVSVDRYDPDGTVTVLDARPATLAAEWSIGGRNVSMLMFQIGRPARTDDYAHASGAGADPGRACGVQLRATRAAIIPGRISHARLLSGASHQKSASRRSAAWERGGPVTRAVL